MRRTKIVGLCLVAVLAASALATSAASASLPEYKVCVPTAGGQFSDKSCQINVGPGEGAYDLKDWTHAKKLGFKAKDGKLTLDIYIPASEANPGAGGSIVGIVECQSSKGTGAITGPKSSEMTLELKNCKGEGKSCGSIVKTSVLHGTLGYVDAAKTKAGVKFTSAGGSIAELECEGLHLAVGGSVIGEYTPVNIISKSATYTFAVNPAGGQAITGFNGATEESFLLAEITPLGVTLPAGLSAIESIKGEAFEVQLKKTPAEELPKWWVEGHLLSGSEAIAEATTVTEPFKQVLFKKKLGAESGFEVQCGEVKVKNGKITGPSTREEEAIVYGACEVIGKPECAVEEAKTNPLTATLEGPVGAEKLKFKPKAGAGADLIKWHILQVIGKPTCAQKGFYKASGQMTCNYKEVETELGEHPLEFTAASGSKVVVNGEPAPFSGTDRVHLASGKLWSAF